MLLVKINSVDRTSLIDWRSFTKNEVLTSQVDTLDFTIKNYGSKTYNPNILDTVEVWDGANKIFGGSVVSVNEEATGRIIKRRVKCKDWTHLFDRKLVVKTYSDLTVNVIIADIVATFCPGFTTANVACSLIVKYIAFNYEQPSKCLQQLAQLFNYDWYIDYNKDIHFFSKETNLAPFDLDDTSGKFVWDSLKLNLKSDQMRNVIYVRGGEYQGVNYFEEQKADGERLVFTFGYKYANIVVKVAGVIKTVGIDNIHDPALYDCLYNFHEKAVKFKIETLPAVGQIVKLEGNPYIPVIVKARENVSIAEFGEYEFKIIDQSIDSKEGARQRASAELLAYANKITEGSFKTYEAGLKTGQKIILNSAILGKNESFIINRIASRVRKSDTGEMEYNCSLVTTRTFGIIEFLQQLIIDENKKIVINKDEVLDKIENVQEAISISELVTKAAAANIAEAISITELVRKDPWGAGVAPTWVLAPYTPTGDDDPKRTIWLDLGGWVS